MNRSNAGYPIGGAKAIVDLMVERFRALGATLRTGVEVAKINVAIDFATGVRLANGEIIGADWVISAADGHATIYDLLGGKYKSGSIDRLYAKQPVFPSYVQVSLGVARDLSLEPGYLARILEEPIQVDPETALTTVTFRTFHYDPTFAPQGKAAITCFLPTYNSIATYGRVATRLVASLASTQVNAIPRSTISPQR